MRNGPPIVYSKPKNTPTGTDADNTTWSLPGAILGFIAWLLALCAPYLIYGSNTLLFFLYTWPFFLALLPVAVIVGVALHSLLHGHIIPSVVTILMSVALLFGALFLWLMG